MNQPKPKTRLEYARVRLAIELAAARGSAYARSAALCDEAGQPELAESIRALARTPATAGDGDPARPLMLGTGES